MENMIYIEEDPCLDLKKPLVHSKILLNGRVQGLRLEHRVKDPRSGEILRHTQEQQNMSVVPAVARS